MPVQVDGPDFPGPQNHSPAAFFRVTMLAVLAQFVCGADFQEGCSRGCTALLPTDWLAHLEGVVRLGYHCHCARPIGLRGGIGQEGVGGICGPIPHLALAVWLTRISWGAKSTAAFLWKKWIIRGVPLTLGMGAYVFMSTQADIFLSRATFPMPANVQFYNWRGCSLDSP